MTENWHNTIATNESGGAKEALAQRFSHFVEHRSQAILFIVIAIVMLAGAAYSIFLGDTLRFPDERDYYRLAVNIAQEGRFTVDGENLTAFRPPGYPALLALLVRCGADVVHLRILNFLAMAVGIYFLHKLLKTYSSACAAGMSAVLILCYPVLFYSAGTLYPQTISATVFLLIVLLLLKAGHSLRRFILPGILGGFLILACPFFTFMLVVTAAFLMCSKVVVSWKGLVLMLLISALPAGAWSVRNYVVFDAFAYVSCNSGLNLLFGNSKDTTATTGARLDMSDYDREAADLGMNEVVRDAFYRTKAIEYMLHNKMRTVELYFKKFLNYFNYRNTLGAQKESSSLKDILMLMTYGPLLAAFVIRVLLLTRYKASSVEVLFIVVYLASALIYAAFITRIRLRLPFDVLMIGVVAAFLGDMCRGRLQRS